MFRQWVQAFLVIVALVVSFVGCSGPPPGPCDTVTCGTGKTCKLGVCVDECTAEQSQCGSTCHDVKTDSNHCGACFSKCRQDEVCKDSKCVLTCTDGKQACGAICADVQTNVLHCGACDNACKAGEVCKAGKCEIFCPDGTTLCGDKCVDTNASTAHCGACGTACKTGEICKAGTCESSCGQGLTDCSGACVDTNISRAHCGACGTACKAGEICTSGKCEFNCPQGQVECSGQCVDTDSNVAHCGACGNACKSGEVCTSGTCKASCGTGQTDCSGSCADLQSSTAHCGACGQACKQGQACISGTCTAVCQDKETNCSGQCVNVNESADHCGACGQACKSGLGCCGAACLDLQTSNTHCGKCGNTCMGGKVCSSGSCACPTGQTDCSGTCADFKSSNDHCGACGTKCTNGKVCVDGACKLGWAVSLGGRSSTSTEVAYRTSVDSNGNVYLVGRFNLEISAGGTTLNTKGIGQALLVAKLNSQLQVQWLAKAESRSFDGWGLTHDSNGNVYVAGHFYDATMSFGTTTLTNSGSSDAFVAKLDSKGAWQWAVRAGGKRDEYLFGISVDVAGNLYVTGYFYATDTEPAVFGSSSLTTNGNGSDIFVGKLNSKGVWQWAVSGGGNSSDNAYNIRTDNAGNSYVAGYIRNTATFGTLSISSKGNGDVFVGKIDNKGAWQWVAGGGSNSSDYAYDLAFDGSGNVYVSGRFYNTATFGTFSLSSKGSLDAFVGKLNNKGVWQWVTGGGGSSSDYAYGVDVDSSGNVYVTGYFYNNATFGSISLTSAGSADIFVGQVSNSGVWQWVKRAGGKTSSENGTSDYGRSVRLDGSGNAYVVGYFYTDADFGSTSISTQGGGDIFVTKLDKSGNFTATTSLGGIGSNYDYAYSIAQDSQGNFYIAGTFQGVMAVGSTTLTSQGASNNVFVAKIDGSGNWLWAKSAGGSFSSSYAFGVNVDGTDNVYITGYYYAEDKGNVVFGSLTFTGTNSSRMFVSKLDKAGAWMWTKDAGAKSNTCQGWGVAVDSSNNVFVTGRFYREATFGSVSLSTNGNNYDVFVAKLDNTGAWIWIKQAGGTSSDYGYGIDVDANGNAYVAGAIYSGSTFGSLTFSAGGSREAFVAKIDGNGTWQWVTGGGGSSSDYAYGIALDSNGNVYTTGYFNNAATFGTFSLSSAGNADIFVAKLDNNGKWLWVKQAGGKQYDVGYGIDVDASGNVYITGVFQEEVSFGSTTLTSSGQGSYIYAARLDTSGNWLGAVATTSKGTSNGGQEGRGISAGKNGNSYVVGTFNGTIMAGNNTLVTEGNSDILVWLVLP
ncbi:MAG: hypothetical protein EP343_08085 [Deltaproteobacteria bacterium]|nr:MAG: hypothetical protein EP343_08085 [Deltaproteobacteria bacterium]